MEDSGQRRHPLGLVFLVVLVFGHVTASEDVCRTECKGAGKTFKYAAGTTYKYNYDGKIEISLSSAEGQSTGTEVKAEVLLTQQDECNQILRLHNVQILGSDGKKVGSIADIEKPIRLNFNDGELSDSICVVDGDNQNSINIKRAIASIFQASLKSGYETDVFGRCPTELSSHKEGNLLVIQKARSLNKCAYRENIQQAFLATAFNLDSEIKSSPLLNGDYRAVLKLKNGVLDQATVTENYIFIPFSVGQNGAKAQVTSKLQYTGTGKDAAEAPVSKPRSIIFENPHPIVASSSSVQSIVNAVKEVAKTIELVVSESTAKEFVNLLKIVRVSKKADLLAAYNQIKSGVGVGDKDAAKRVYIDALLRSGNGESVEALLELIIKNELSESDSKLALLGLNVVRHATEGALSSATHLLDNANLPREAYLGVGNLAGHFCRQHSCENNAAVKALLSKLLTKISNKATNREQENDIIYALKALGNVGFLNDNTLQKLTGIAQNKNLPNRVRVVALEAYLADPCKNKLRDSALQILQDIQQDTEIRIKAYLVVAQCPNAKAGNAIKALIEKEPSIQVGGFITSHLRTIRTSTNPDKALAKQFLNFVPKKQFIFDPRRYSFNGEFSYAIDTLGVATSTEANLIYSQNSWLPRSTSLNLTTEVFGHNFNFLELETRQENLDRLVEHYLGPNGLVRSTPGKEFVSQAVTGYGKLTEYVHNKLKSELHRAKRDVTKAEIDAIAKQVQVKTNELNKDLDLDLTIRAFGSELFFVNVNQETASLTPEAIVDRIVSQLSQGLDKLVNFHETLRRNLLFLDAQIDYPTSLGFPLRLAVEGSASLQAQVQGAVDVRKILNNPDNGQLSLKLIPSANIEISGRLTLDALVVENGLKVVSNLYTATGGDASLSWDKSSGFEFKFGLPVQEQKIVSANHEIVFHTREQAGKEKNLPLKFTQVKDFSVCLDQFSPFIGLTFCAEVNGPNVGGKQVPILPFPLAGDAKLALTIENDDVSEFLIKHSVQGNPPTHADLVLQTIGKNKAVKATLDLQGEYSPEKFIKLSLTSAGKNAGAELRYIHTNVERSLLAKVNNDQDVYSAKLGIAISGSPQRTVYKPLVELKTPGGQQVLPVQVQGQIIVESNGNNVKYVFDNVKFLYENRQFSITGHVGNEGGVIDSDIKLSDGKESVNLVGRFQATSELINFNAKVLNTINSKANFNLKGEFKKQPKLYESSLSLVHGPDLNSKTSVLTLKNSFVNHYVNAQDYKLVFKNSVNYPLLGVGAKLELEKTPKTLEYEVSAEYGEVKFGSELELKTNQKSEGDYDLEFDLWGLENKVELKSSRQVLPNDESKIKNTIEVNGKKLEIDGKVRHSIRPHSIDVGADLSVNLPTQAAPFKVSSGLKINKEEFDGFQKISSGNEVIVDAFLKANPGLDANGILKVNIKNIINIDGKIHSNKGSGNGEVLVDIQGGQRQVKGETSFHIVPLKVLDFTFTLYPSFNKDKNLKLFLSTNNKYSDTSLESSNKVDILGNPLELNLKVSKTGDSKNGKLDSDVEITLLNDQYIAIKAACDHKHINNLESGQSQGSIEYRKNKNAAGKKLTFKGVWKDTSFEDKIFDIDYTFSADDSNGQNINYDIALKRSVQGNNNQISGRAKLYGSALKNPHEASITLQGNAEIGQYEYVSTHGPGDSVNIKGNYDIKNEDKASGAFNLQASSTCKALKTLNLDLKGSVVRPRGIDQPIQLEGSVNIFADDDGTQPEPIIDFKSQGSLRAGIKDGEVKGNVVLHKVDPINFDASYNIEKSKESGHLLVNYANGKSIKLDGSFERVSELHIKLAADLHTPVEGYKSVNLLIDSKRTKDNREFQGLTKVTVEGKVYKLESDLALSDLSPVIDIKYTNPEGKISQAYLKGNKVNDRQYGGEVKIISEPRQFHLDGSLNVNIETIDNFVIKGKINSPSLKWNKIVFEAQNKPGNNDRKIQILVKSDGKNIISGSTSYSSKEENGKVIVEGSGSFKVHEETKSGNFKYISQKLETAKNGEQGTQESLDAVLGSKAIDAEFKLTDKHFRFQTSVCEQKKECTYVEIDNKITSNDINNFNQVLEVNLDLRKLGLSHEFGLKAVTSKKQWLIDHTVDAHFQNQENSKYQYSFYIHPQEAGLSLTTPKRIIALEGKAHLDQKSGEYAKGNGDIGFYLDKKNHANKRTALTWSFDANARGIVTGDVKFTHPGLRKPLSASVKTTRSGTPYKGKLDFITELDVFAQDNQKIVTTYTQEVNIDESYVKGLSKRSITIQSKGLGIDFATSEDISADRNARLFSYDCKARYHGKKANYENVYSVKLSPKEQSCLLKLFNKNIFKYLNKFIEKTDKELIVESEVSSFDNNPILGRLELKNYNSLAYSVGFKKTPNNKLTFNAALIPGQIADVRADDVIDGKKTPLYYVTVKLDDADFLKSDHKLDSKALETVLQREKQFTENYFKSIEGLVKEWSEQAQSEVQLIGEILKKAQPNLNPLRQYYTTELEEFKQEILNDKSLKELSEAVTQVLGAFISALTDLVDKLSQIAENAVQALQSTFAGVIDSIEKQLIPQIKEAYSKLLGVAKNVLGTVSDIVFAVLGKISHIIEQYQPELKSLATSFSSVGQDLGKVLQSTYQSLREFISNIRIDTGFVAELKSQYQQLIKEGLPNAEVIINTIGEVFNTVKDVIPPEFIVKDEIAQFLDTLVGYIEKKLKNQEVNDGEVFDKLGKIVVSIINKIVNLVSSECCEVSAAKLDHQNIIPPSLISSLPRLVAARFSVLNYLQNENTFAEVSNLISSILRSPTLLPPFPLFGLVIQGQHIFTFDGEQYSIPGTCNYLFARDAVNGNFSIAGSYKDGHLASVTLADKNDVITLVKGGQVKVGNAAQELPVRRPNLAAWRDYEVVTLLSTSGASVVCVPDLTGCAVSISGYYHGQVKGLLGNGNSEPFDDYTLPSGKVVTSESEFVNSYKLNSGCADVTVKSDAVPENPICNKLFSWESSLSPCFAFVPVEKFKLACARGLASGTKGTEESIAKAYVAACHERKIPVHVPKTLLKCTNSDKPYSIGESFSVKLPSKSADVVIILDTDKQNEVLYKQLLQPLIQDVTKEFHTKGITDVEYHLITYGGLNQWPSHVTAGGKLTFKGKVPQVKFGDSPKDELSTEEIKNSKVQYYASLAKELFHDLKLATGLNLKTQTYDEAYKYPFRVNALKSIIVVNGQSCEVGKLYPIQKLIASLYSNSQISINLFSPVKTLSVKDPKKIKDIVGFNDESVITLSQSKKAPKGSSELHKELDYEDYCLEFVINNRGNVFINENFLNNKGEQKQFLHTAAVNIVDQLINKEQGLDCECKLVNPWNAANVCKESFIKDRASKKV